MDIRSEQRIYSNAGNAAVVSFLGEAGEVVLDVGCGAGDNAALLLSQNPTRTIFGITASASEAVLASRWMSECWVADLEMQLPAAVRERTYDVILCSHVLEHLRNPVELVARLSALLRPGGVMVIAVPNVLCWRERIRFLAGRFEYEESGTMDRTHLRFFTYHTARSYLLDGVQQLHLTDQRVVGSVPLWILRRWFLPEKAARALDRLGSRRWPNLFGREVLLKAVKAG